MSRLAGAAVLTLASVALAGTAHAGALAVRRAAVADAPARAEYRVTRPGTARSALGSHHVAGFDQRTRLLSDGRTEVTVVVRPGPVRSTAAWPAAAAGLPPDVARFLVREQAPLAAADAVGALAHEIGVGAERQLELSERVITWVSLNIVHADAPGHDESPAATLEAGGASCVGKSRLAVDLMRCLGIPARGVHGLLMPVGTRRGSVVGSAHFALHRFVESWVDDVGWLPSDPGESVHLVDARHLVLAVEGQPYDPESQRGLLVVVARPPDALSLAAPGPVPPGALLLVRPAPFVPGVGVGGP